MTTLAEWLSYLETIHSSSIDLGLQRIGQLAELFGVKRFDCQVVMVAGTNGKGSVVRTLESIYHSAGYQTAAYTSPHLLTFNERLRVNTGVLADEVWISAFEQIEQHRQSCSLSFFEFVTLAALLICRDLPLDILLLEVGLGGRLDAVNIVDSDVAVITSVDIDHVDWLGDDREVIGVEKAGIYQQNQRVVCGDPSPPQSVFEVVNSLNAELFCWGRDYTLRAGANGYDFYGPFKDLVALPCPALKLENVATAIMVTELIDLPLTQLAYIHGIKRAKLEGRFEQSSDPCPMIFDVAHNPQSARYLANQLGKLSVKGRCYALFSMLKDKDVENTLTPLIPLIDEWYVATLDAPRAMASELLMTHLTAKGAKACYTFDLIGDALARLIEVCQASDVIVVFGSFHTVASAKRHLQMESSV